MYSQCDQCLRHCPVTALRCDNGKRHYREVTGKEGEAAKDVGKESAYRRMIRERRQRKAEDMRG